MSLAEWKMQLLLRLCLRRSQLPSMDAGLVHIGRPSGGCALRREFTRLGAWIASALLLAGCIDPGPGPRPVTTPRSVASASKTATLFWEAPTSNTNGSPLTNLAGYRIYYGSNPGELVQTIQIGSIGMQTYVIDDLQPGTWYFAIVAVATNGVESSLSNIAVKTIT
jgi:hypothetical protein